MLLILSGCSGIEPAEELVTFSFTASIDAEVLTKGVGDGSSVDWCVMELFYGGESVGQTTAAVSSGKVSFAVPVVANRTYDVAFWAEKKDVYGTSSLKAVILPDDMSGENADAFCGTVKDMKIGSESAVRNVILKRPFGVVTITPAAPTDSPHVSYAAPKRYNVLTDGMTDLNSFSFDYSAPFYVLASSEKTTMMISIGGRVCDGVPVQRNYKTNINISNN